MAAKRALLIVLWVISQARVLRCKLRQLLWQRQLQRLRRLKLRSKGKSPAKVSPNFHLQSLVLLMRLHVSLVKKQLRLRVTAFTVTPSMKMVCGSSCCLM